MDDNVKAIIDIQIKKTIENLRKNNMEAYYVPTKEDAAKKAVSLMSEGETTAVGGSVTLFETGIIDILRNGRYNFLDRYKKNLTATDTQKIFLESFLADTYLTSANAITQAGELYNVDGNGNRVAAMIYGPKSVIVVAGYNKIVKDRGAAVERVRNTAAPANCVRLGRDTPCTKAGECMDCMSTDRICCSYVFLGRQRIKGRIKVIIVGEELGY